MPSRTPTLLLLVSLAASAPAIGAAEPIVLEHLGSRHNSSLGSGRHLMGVESVFEHHALVSAFVGVCLIDVRHLEQGGPPGCLDSLPQLDATTTVTRDDGFSYVNLRADGFAVVYVDEAGSTLTLGGKIVEPGVFFEKMSVVGDRLYVAAHGYGIRIFDLTLPSSPALIGSLQEGLDDAFAVAVSGSTAYVADGAGGLKVVNLADETAPVILHGETPATAAGTAEDVLVHDGYVYVAAGGAGVAVYDLGGNPQTRRLYNTPVCAKHLALVGDHLAVADIGGLEIFAIEPDGSLSPAARERGRFRSIDGELSLRLWHGVDAYGTDRVLVADWDTVDLYRLAPAAAQGPPDVTASRQRIRFAPQGGSEPVRLTNDGAGPLTVWSIAASAPTFAVSPASALVPPGGSVELDITYAGGQPGSGLILVSSDDPDESPLPIQVYGETAYLDPGEAAAPFDLTSWTIDHGTGTYSQARFDSDSYAGRVVFLHVFRSG